ncbi:MAG: ATP synthase subunit I [Desulfobacteraceae bacterium]|nr:ATP synthase subunit I [Desulfobacteraceae bacterium]
MENKKKKIGNQDNELTQIQPRICYWAITFTIIISILFILVHEKAIAKGLLLGTCFSIINFFLLGKSIPMTLGKSRSKAGLISLASILFRYLILAIPMIVAIKSISFNFVAVVIGIFAVQIVTLINYIVIRPIFYGRNN